MKQPNAANMIQLITRTAFAQDLITFVADRHARNQSGQLSGVHFMSPAKRRS